MSSGIDRFDRTRFEASLPVGWTDSGMVTGERAYLIPAGPVAITLRSSLASDNLAAECGENSIRAWLVDPITGMPWGNKLNTFTTRRRGWEERLAAILARLAGFAARIVPCPACGELPKAFLAKRGPTKGRAFLSCQCGRKQSLDESVPVPVSQPALPAPSMPLDERKPAPAMAAPVVVPDAVDVELTQARHHAYNAPCPHCGHGDRWAFRCRKEGKYFQRVAIKCNGCGSLDWLTAAVAPVIGPVAARGEEGEAAPCEKCGGRVTIQKCVKDGHPKYGQLFGKCDDCSRWFFV